MSNKHSGRVILRVNGKLRLCTDISDVRGRTADLAVWLEPPLDEDFQGAVRRALITMKGSEFTLDTAPEMIRIEIGSMSLV